VTKRRKAQELLAKQKNQISGYELRRQISNLSEGGSGPSLNPPRASQALAFFSAPPERVAATRRGLTWLPRSVHSRRENGRFTRSRAAVFDE
jgi:hypothetical protein